MKLIHLSDLHLGKRLKEISLIEDQKYILEEILKVIDDEKPDGVMIAGDIYDRSVPSAEAVELFDDFLVKLAERKMETFIISGNHDSPERLAFGNRLIDVTGIHLSPVYDGKVKSVELKDENGSVNIYMMPFVKPANVRRFYPDAEIETYTDAMQVAIENMNVDFEKRNILLAHQFVTGATRSDSEDVSVGGLDNVDARVFEGFDYVALGHIHGPQNIERGRVRYCGTPLKYSFSEADHEKSVTVVEIFEKGNMQVRTVPLKPLRDLVVLKGNYVDVTMKRFYEGTTYQEDYTQIVLTDEEDVPDALATLRTIYHNLLVLKYDNTRTRNSAELELIDDVESKSPLELFAEFYRTQNGADMSQEQQEYITGLIEKIWENK